MAGITLISGPSGSGKTSLLADAAEWCWKRHKKVSRIYVGDLGGWSDKLGNLVKLGIAEVWKLRTRVGTGGEGLVEETLRLASLGWWPAEIDAATGEVLPAVTMLPPVVTVHRLICVNGHPVREAATQRELVPQMCPTCKASTSLQNCREVEKVSAISEHFKHVGLLMYEGLTSWGDWGMTALADRRAKNELAGEKSSIGRFTSGSVELDGNNRADYGFMQGEAYRWLQNAGSIIGLVRPPIWTALEDLTKNGDAWGPSIPGSAATAVIPQWVGDYIGVQRVAHDGKGYRRLCLAAWVGDDGKPHRYKLRVDGGIPPYLEDEDDPQSPKFDQFSLGRFFDMVDAAGISRYEKQKAAIPDAPGNAGHRVWGEKSAARPTSVPAAGAPAGPALPSPVPASAPVAGAPPPGVALSLPKPGGKLPPPRPPAAAPKPPGR